MSSIDGQDHFTVGYFLGIPVYQPLFGGQLDQSLVDERPYNALPGQLVIGGGAGEHPAIIICDLEHCVAELLCSGWSPVSARPSDEVKKIASKMDWCATEWRVEFCEWTPECYIAFEERCRPEYTFFSEAEPKNDELDDESENDAKDYRYHYELSLVTWLCLSVGEFVYAALPDISERILRWRREFGPIEFDWFRNILLAPPGYPDPQRRRPEDPAYKIDVRSAERIVSHHRFEVRDRFPGFHEKPDWEAERKRAFKNES